MSKAYLEKMDRTAITVSRLQNDPLEETKFWLTKSPLERLIGLEILRKRLSNYDNITSRLQRVFTVTERA